MTNQMKLAGKLLKENTERKEKERERERKVVYIPFTYIMCTSDSGYYYDDIIIMIYWYCASFLQFVFFYR